MADLSPGQVVSLTDGRQATVRFVGSTHFAAGDWIGIELDEPTGKNDGAVQGERYFECEHGFGMFIRPSAVVAVIEQPKRESKPPPKVASNVTTATRRPQSTIVSGSAGARRPSVLGSATKRQSVSAASPSPAPRVAPGQRTLRVWRTQPDREGEHADDEFQVSYKVTDKAARYDPSFSNVVRGAPLHDSDQNATKCWFQNYHGPSTTALSGFEGFTPAVDGA